MRQTIMINVHGKVQGVNYREATRRKALSLGICGTVQNLEDGSVQIMATGNVNDTKQLEEWCQQGPLLAKVDSVQTIPQPLQEFDEFQVLRK